MKDIFHKTKTEKGIRAVSLVAFILLFLSFLFTLYANNELVKQANRIEHTNNVIKTLNTILGKTVDAETGIRGYILTKDTQFLAPYYGSREITDSLLQLLKKLTGKTSSHQERLSLLDQLIHRRFEILEYHFDAFTKNNLEMTDSMRILQVVGKKVMEDLRSQITLIDEKENISLKKSEEAMIRTSKAINAITIVSLSLAFCLLFFGFITYLHVNKARKKAQLDLNKYQGQLTNRIAELDKANTELINFRSLEKLAVTGRIARAIAHEIRNPLTNINLAADQIRSGIMKKDETGLFLFDMINRNSNRINQLISDLLSSTKFSDLSYEKTVVTDLLDETLAEAADRIALNKVRVIKQYGKESCTVSVDRAKIKVAFLNIIINAIEAMEEQDKRILRLETSVENNKCKIIISDTGTGMDSEALTRLFEAYYTSKPKGNGLGLTNTQNIVLNHNGEINVKSSKGKGTSFTIILDFVA